MSKPAHIFPDSLSLHYIPIIVSQVKSIKQRVNQDQMENIMANCRKKDYLLLLLYRIKYRSPTVRYLIGKSLRCRGIHVSNGETHSIP